MGEISKGEDCSEFYPSLRGAHVIWTITNSWGLRRYNKVLLDDLKQRVEEGTVNPCIQSGVLKNPEANNLTEEELISISLSMMAVGLISSSMVPRRVIKVNLLIADQ
jgi:hypothetical protein